MKNLNHHISWGMLPRWQEYALFGLLAVLSLRTRSASVISPPAPHQLESTAA